MAKVDRPTPPPYVTYKSFENFIRGFREGNSLPTHLTRSIFPGSNSGKATMGLTLKYLGLINEASEPTEAMRQLVDPDRGYAAELRGLILRRYEFLNDPDFDLENTTTDKVVEKIKASGASGSTITKCMAFFLSACREAGIEVSQYVKAPAQPRALGKKARKAGKVGDAESTTVREGEAGNHPESAAVMERITVPLRNMQDGVIYFPKELEQDEARKAVKAAIFILNNYYDLDPNIS